MQITYKSRKLEKICASRYEAEKQYNSEMAQKLQLRINQIAAAENVEIMVRYTIGRCHPLLGNRKGQYAVDLVQPFRLVFEQIGAEIRIANILEIVDYH